MRHLAEAKTHQTQGCSPSHCCCCSPVVSTQKCYFPYLWNSLDFRAVVLLSFEIVFMQTRFGSLDALLAGPLRTDTTRSRTHSYCMGNWKKKITYKNKRQLACFLGRIMRLHSVSSSHSFISKPWAWQEVSLRGVFNSDLVYSQFCINESPYFSIIVRVICEFSWNGSVILYF